MQPIIIIFPRRGSMGSLARMRPSGVSSSLQSRASSSGKQQRLVGFDSLQHNYHKDIEAVPLSVCSASITASNGGGSMALDKKFPMAPSLRSLMLRATSCSGVRKISGVIWVSSLHNNHCNHHFICSLILFKVALQRKNDI